MTFLFKKYSEEEHTLLENYHNSAYRSYKCEGMNAYLH